MEYLALILPDEFGSQHLFMIGAVLVMIGIYLQDIWSSQYWNVPWSINANSYDYSECNGPATWKMHFVAARGKLQSPLNLQERCATTISSRSAPELKFSPDFHTEPYEMKLVNNGHSVVIYASWEDNVRPSLYGGPLDDDYKFINIRFRWGPNDHEGSEHMVNSTRYAMELQAAFIKSGAMDDDIVKAAESSSLVFLSYLFMITPIDNPYLEPIISSLQYLQTPMSCICIEPVILSLLMPDFSIDYYSYVGSLTFPPCTEGVRWIVKPEPLMISSRQVRKFRKLQSYSGGRIATNTRTVQNINNREIKYYN